MDPQKKPIMDKLEAIALNYQQLVRNMADPDIASDPKEYQRLARQQKELEPIVEAYRAFRNQLTELEEYEHILASRGEDPDLVELARESLPDAKQQVETGFYQIQRLLLPKDPMDGKNAVLEIRAGTGGDEAGLFAAEMFRAYSRFAENRRWKVTVSHLSETDIGGIKEITAVIEGKDVYSLLKYESGIHRVQRVPQTESQGRVHTSAITVAVLPEVEDVEIEVLDKDLRVDTFRSSGAGGQHVNTTDSAVRVTHLPSGVVVSCQDERSKIKNLEKAMRILKAHLYEAKRRELESKISEERRLMVGSGDRSEKIRTYNFPQSRVTDHRVKVTLYKLDDFMNGNIIEMVEACRTQFEAQRIEQQIAQP